MKLLIVDDEIRTVNGIIKCLDWNELGIDEIQYAHNGCAALMLLENFPADIVLSDIHMPKMGGIELSQKLSQIYPAIRIVFITGYTDINYMKSAFKAKVVDYILKPVDVKELREVMERITSSFRLEDMRNSYLKEMEAKVRLSLPLLQENFFIGLISNDFAKPETIEKKLSFLRLNLKEAAKYVTFVIVEDGFENCEDAWDDKNLLAVAILNITREIISAYTAGYCFEKSGSHFVCILSLKQLLEMNEDDTVSIEEKLESIGREINATLHKSLNISTTIGIGVWVDRLSEIPISYDSAQQAAARRLYLGKDQVILGGNTSIHREPYIHIDFYNYNKLYTAIINADVTAALSIVAQIFSQINQIKNHGRNQILLVCNQIISAVNSGLMESVECKEDELAEMSKIFASTQSSATIAELQELIENHIRQTVKRVVVSSISCQQSVVELVKRTVQNSYGENISLRTLAKEAYLSPAYLCLLFKQETGQTLTNYITSMRIENAKLLLTTTEKKLIDICFEVGFNDSKYFSRIFKKYTGITPSEYRAHPESLPMGDF